MSRAEADLQLSVKKACNADEVPPKRKHVRACIVYTWDHKNSREFWNAVKIQPLQSHEVQLFKALIMIHKVLQEGHPNTLKDAYRNRDFLSSLATVFSAHGNGSYGRLINQYDKYILQKLDFHRNNPGFNGMFEYEEYISLRAVNDPNEGYESILQLMDLQDSINDLQKMIFATINQTPNNLCKVSALVPLISESYGIYKFCTSMLRAMFQQLGADEALEGLFQRFDSHHFMLRDFYTDCNAIKFLTSLITIPRLPNNPPNLQVTDEGVPISRPRSVNSNQVSEQQQSFEAPQSAPPDLEHLKSQQTGYLFQQQQEQERIQQQLEYQRQQQLEQQQLQQRLFEDQQREQERLFLQEQTALQAQQTAQHHGRVSELEHDLLMFKNQYDNDQQLLQQYDARVKSLETELQTFNNTATQQVASKDEQIRNLEEQISNWTKKYESLAKLYSQLRQEHLNLLNKFKKIQQKITSAQESILKKEKFEKDLKSKNVELADLIRERDRARLDLDRLRASKDQEIEKLEAQVRELNSQANEAGRQSINLSSLIAKHESEKDELKKQLANGGNTGDLEDKLREKEVELEIAQESLESAMQALELNNKDNEDIINSQIDEIILKNIDKLKDLIDLILENNIIRVQDSRHELASTMQAGNLNATPEYVLSIIELTSDTATDFASIFNNYIAAAVQSYDDSDTTYSDIILKSSDLATNVIDLMLNTKGITRLVPKEDEENLLNIVEDVLSKTIGYFETLKSESLKLFDDDDDKIDAVIDGNLSVQNALQELGKNVDGLRSKSGIDFNSGNLEDIVNNEMKQTAQKVDSASKFLDDLLKNPNISGGDIEVHEAILAAAKSITDAVIALILAATESQKEIVTKGKGAQSRTAFYKKNNRWTEGLISASKAVAGATNILIQTADGVLKQTNSHEQLIVASNEVAASTAQLVSASRVKANFISKTQDYLETASSQVSSACKVLVSKVQGLLSKQDQANNDIDLSKLTPYEGKTVEMEQQVEILKLENKLAYARKRLGEIRKHGYRDDNSDDES
ncbi:structural constituent of cytoskeleton [Scheffersomyces coipomensis]|uniref:structural constituent of cytoskeleton n=1 Tax=Scheffersomyces coipomensis TaxID=1788519 RepID=UPI00315DEC81